MKNHVKNQHLVPQFLLKNFASRDEAFIWAYDKNEKYNEQNRIKERAIKKVASEKYFYDKNKKDPESSYEYVLQEIENNSAPIIAEIIPIIVKSIYYSPLDNSKVIVLQSL